MDSSCFKLCSHPTWLYLNSVGQGLVTFKEPQAEIRQLGPKALLWAPCCCPSPPGSTLTAAVLLCCHPFPADPTTATSDKFINERSDGCNKVVQERARLCTCREGPGSSKWYCRKICSRAREHYCAAPRPPPTELLLTSHLRGLDAITWGTRSGPRAVIC